MFDNNSIVFRFKSLSNNLWSEFAYQPSVVTYVPGIFTTIKITQYCNVSNTYHW